MARERGRLMAGPGDRGDGRDRDAGVLVPPKRAGRQLLVGAFVLVGLLAVLIALFTLTSPGMLRGRYYLYSVVPNAGGIRKGDPVQYRGVNVGRVTGFDIGAGGVVITLELENQYKVPADSHMALESGGLLGGMTATILPGRAANVMASGDTIPGVVEAGAFDVAATVGQRADTVLARASALLSQETVANLGESAAQLRAVLAQTAAMVAEDRANIRALTASLRETAAGLAAARPGERIASTTARLDSLSLQLAGASARLNTASASLQVVLGRIEKGEGTLGKLSADPALYDNLNAAARNLNQLAADIRANPKRYINVKVF